MALRLAREIQVNEQTLAYDLIEKVGQDGHFLAQKHTVDWFPIEEHIPSVIIDKMSKSQWERTGSKNTLDRAREYADKTLKEHAPKPLPPDAERELDAFMSEVFKKAK